MYTHELAYPFLHKKNHMAMKEFLYTKEYFPSRTLDFLGGKLEKCKVVLT